MNADPEKTTVTISPGVTTGELMAFFLANNICFESDAILSTMTYGGLFTGGCHVSFVIYFCPLLYIYIFYRTYYHKVYLSMYNIHYGVCVCVCVFLCTGSRK